MYSTPILLAVSGGLDSMVMLHQFHAEYGAEFIAVAHCNFRLRAEESDGDEAIVRAVCEELQVKCHVVQFDAALHAAEMGLGIQEAARELRYSFFFNLKKEHGYQAIATAHHRDDSVETFFINLLRGSGPRGLSGISEDAERDIIRPLLHMTRIEILSYAKLHQLNWREDSSNTSNAYLRNRIRQELLPLLQDLRPGFDQVMQRNMEVQGQLTRLLDSTLEQYQKDYCKEENGQIRIRLEGDADHALMLRQMLGPLGFTSTQIRDILNVKQGGRQVGSPSHMLTAHKGSLLLTERQELARGPWLIQENLRVNHIPLELELTILPESPKSLDRGVNTAFLAADQLRFPLTVRASKPGDRVQPLGMRGVKKVSDLLSDMGLSLEEKKRVYLLLSGEEVIWVIGHRISERYKVRSDSRAVLKIEWHDADRD